MADPAGILPLFCWLSPAFPIGAFAYSHALEWACEAGDIRDEPTLQDWLDDILLDGFGRNDALLAAAAYRAAQADDPAALADVNALALALASSAEFRLETAQQGRSFLDAVASAWPCPALARPMAALDEAALPVSVGVAAAAHRIPLEATLAAYLVSLAQNLVSAALRLAPIGQSAGQRVLARSVPRLARLATECLEGDLDAIGSGTIRADLGSLRHETQYTRLFRS